MVAAPWQFPPTWPTMMPWTGLSTRIERELGPIDVWVNVAMATVFSPVSELTAEEIERSTKVTYLGQVHGMMAALKRMRTRNRGTIVNVGSALAYRGDSAPGGLLRRQIRHPRLHRLASIRDHPRRPRHPPHDGRPSCREHAAVRLVAEQDGAQGRCRCRRSSSLKSRRGPSSSPPPTERRQIWVGFPTVKAILANRIAPALIDRYLASAGYSGQLTDQDAASRRPVQPFRARSGRLRRAWPVRPAGTPTSWEMFTDRHRAAFGRVPRFGAAFLVGRAFRRTS